VYLPAVLNHRRLRDMGIEADVEVLERYFTAESRAQLALHRRAYRDNFDLALMAHRMTRDVLHCVERLALEQLLHTWRCEGRRRFVVWSGFWLPVLQQYRDSLRGAELNVDICRIDAAVSASFKVHGDAGLGAADIWLWNGEERRIVHEIHVLPDEPIPFDQREPRLVVHGGGWGLGTYRDVLTELESTPYALDVVIFDPDERRSRPNDRYFMSDPAWSPWQQDPANPTFPPLGQVTEEQPIVYSSSDDVHELHCIIRSGRAIVSKPGGCTLIDSLASATPVVFLDAYGYAEERNAEIWQDLGFGISYAAWRDDGYSFDTLTKLHESIKTRYSAGAAYPLEVGVCSLSLERGGGR
jgi:hypothetical protein